MKKTTKKTLKLRADKLFSALIRSRGKCERCGDVNDTLQCCHIFSRRYLSTRWLEDNALCLDAKCHFWAHSNPIEFAEFVREYKGNDEYEALRVMAKVVVGKSSVASLTEVIAEMKENHEK